MVNRSNPEPSHQELFALWKTDFNRPNLYAKPDARYPLFFEYLKLSPSYALALKAETVQELAALLNDEERATKVWKTRTDVGDVFNTIYKEWWTTRGLSLFGIQSRRPRITPIARLYTAIDDVYLKEASSEQLVTFVDNLYQQQGRPDSLLVSIPLSQKQSVTIRQLKAALKNTLERLPVIKPKPKYEFVANKMHIDRLGSGFLLVLYRILRPKDELWRVASLAKISKELSILDPNGAKKDSSNAHIRRSLTIMASRLYRETLIIAENAATGKFPSRDPINVIDFDAEEMRVRLKRMIKNERAIRNRINQAAKEPDT